MSTYGYIATWKNKRVEVTINEGEGGVYKAQCIAAEKMGVPAKKRHEVAIGLAEKDGVPIVHTAC